MNLRVDLNADLGEAFGAWTMGEDGAMLALVSSANIACGFHAGDPMVMTASARAAIAAGVGIGAHPGYHDLQGFGRRAIAHSAAEIAALTIYQIGALIGIATAAGGRVAHVKPHGALNNLAAIDRAVADAVAAAIHAVDPTLIFLAPAGSAMVAAGRALGLRVAEEVFADRNYDDDGNLVSRARPDAMVTDPDQAAANVLAMIRHGRLTSVTGKHVACNAQSVCIHGDSPLAVHHARTLRAALDQAGVSVVPLTAIV